MCLLVNRLSSKHYLAPGADFIPVAKITGRAFAHLFHDFRDDAVEKGQAVGVNHAAEEDFFARGDNSNRAPG